MFERKRKYFLTVSEDDFQRLIGDLVLAQSRIQTLTELVTLNEVTGLPNKNGINEYVDRLRRACNRIGLTDGKIALISGDLKKFKEINDNFGDSVGNEVLFSVGEALQKYHRPEDLVANPWGDTFLVLALISNPQNPNKQVSVMEHKVGKAVDTVSLVRRDLDGNERTIRPQIKVKSQIVELDENFDSMVARLRSDKYRSPRSQ